MKKYVKFLIVIIVIVIAMQFLQADDKELFMGLNMASAVVKPNVIVLMDSSGSMNSIVAYPKLGLDGIAGTADDGFDSTKAYTGTLYGYGTVSTGTYWSTTSTSWDARWVLGTNAYENDNWTGVYNKTSEDLILCGSNGQAIFKVGDWIINQSHTAVARIKTKTDCSPVAGDCGSWLELEQREGTFALGASGDTNCLEVRFDGSKCRVVKLYGGVDHGWNTRYPHNYLKWLYIYATEAHVTAVSHFSKYGTFDTTDFTAWRSSDCSTSGTTFDKQTFTRIQVAREVCCKIAEDSRYIVNLGLFRFDESYGGYQIDSLHDMSELASLVEYKKKIYTTLEGEAMTPLAEALADVWYYYRPGSASKPYMPVNLDTAVSSVHDIEWWCQNNYVLVVTDGESTMDRFSGDGRFTGSLFTTYPVRRTEPWVNWNNGWGDTDNNEASEGIPASYNPTTATYCRNYSCWLKTVDGFNYDGSDFLDDVAYFMAHSDLFPEYNLSGALLYGDNPDTGWPGLQAIYTYVIGFAADNDMLRATAINGEGAYYTATTYEELVNAFQSVITSILLRNFAFSAITAPKKTATATNTDQTLSYVGYFMPSQAASVWEGHMGAYELFDKWGYDEDGNDEIDEVEYAFADEDACLEQSSGKPCQRLIQLSDELLWDAAWSGKIPANRNLFSHNETSTLFTFDTSNLATIRPLIGAADDTETTTVIEKLRQPWLADIFHADVGFVGPPIIGKKYLPLTNPLDDEDETYDVFYEAHKNRRRVIYTGTNDGIFHMFYADDPTYEDLREAGREVWGLIPDKALPSLRDIVVNNQHTYTVDGRIRVEDIYFKKAGDPHASWSTVLGFGMREGGDSFYQLDVTDIGSQPTIMWRFNDPVYSGKSWGKPTYGKIKLEDASTDSGVRDQWVVIFTGGFAYNHENPNDLKGKALFIVDAGTGELLWMLGYDPTYGADITGNQIVANTSSSDDRVQLTKAALFNFSVPSAITAVDKDFDGFLDAIYFANVGGNLFKIDISSIDIDQWKENIRVLYKSNVVTQTASYITAINNELITVKSDNDYVIYDTLMGRTSRAMGYIIANETNNVLTVTMLSGTFVNGEYLDIKEYDPIFLSPAVAFDTCYNLWVNFGTGDRDRPRSNNQHGKCVTFIDTGTLTSAYYIGSGSTLTNLTGYWSAGALTTPTGTTITNGFYFDFVPVSATTEDPAEKPFDPEPLIIPDKDMVPHIYLNTYKRPPSRITNKDNPCDIPPEGIMTLYDIKIANCGEVVGERFEGRISGGGVYGEQYVMFIGTPLVGSTPPLEETSSSRLPYPGGIVFWKEKKR